MHARPILLATLVLLPLATGCSYVRKTSDFFAGRNPAYWARQMEDTASPDNRSKGINQLVENNFAKRPPYTTRYRQIATSDPDPLVRAVAVRALNRARDAGATDVYVTALNDSSELVRLEGAKALANLPDPSAVPGLLKLVNKLDESRDVRIAAAEALK